MNEIMTKTFELIDALDQSDIIKNITKYKKQILDNKELQQLIKKGNKEQNEYLLREIKQKLYTYPEYKNYMHNYNELMYIVLNINNRFNKLIDNKNCNRG